MGATIAATAYAMFAIVGAFFLRPRAGDKMATLRGWIFWFVTTPLLFLIYPLLPALLACGIAFALLTPNDPGSRLAFYLMALFAIPESIKAEVPFPGINYLIVLSFPVIACFVLFVPAIAFSRAPNAARYAPWAGVMLILLTLLSSVQEFRSENITNGLRGVIGYFVLYALPYMGAVRLAPTRAETESVISAFLALAVIIGCIAFVSEAVDWNFYTLLTERHGDLAFADFREGILRVSATVIPVLVGYMAGVGYIAVDYFRSEKKLSTMTGWLYRGLFAAAVLFTFSRGAWLAVAVGLLAYHFFTNFPRSIRPPLIAAAVVLAGPAAFLYVMEADLDKLDPYGSFEYRREIINASIVQFKEFPLFGHPKYRFTGNFDHLYQGQGIIDVVNHYAHILLKHGLVGFIFYIGAFIAVLVGLLNLGKFVRRSNDKRLERQRAFLLAAVLSYLALIATVSGVSLIQQTGVFLIAVSAAFVAAARKEFASPAFAGPAIGAAAETAEGPSAPGAQAAPDKALGDLFG